MNRKSLILTESEKNRILGMHKLRFEIQKNFIFEQAIDGQVVQGPAGDPYQYKVEAGKAYYAKKSEGANPKWVEQKNPAGIKAIQDKIIKPATPAAPATPTGATTNTGTTTDTSATSTGTTTGNTSQALGQGLASRKDLRQDARQQRRDARQDERQKRRATKEQEQQCNTWFRNYSKFKATMKPEQLKQYEAALNATPCCEILPAEEMKKVGLTSCAAQPQSAPAAPATPPAATPAPPTSGAPTPPQAGTTTT
jgi:hypothetical protein